MSIEDLLAGLVEERQALDSTLRTVRSIQALNQDRATHLAQIRSEVKRLRTSFREESLLGAASRNVLPWLGGYEQDLRAFEAKTRLDFAVDLERELLGVGYVLTGRLPELEAGLFRLEISFDAWSVRIWFGPKQESLERCPLNPAYVARRLRESESELGAGLDALQFEHALRSAYSKAQGGTSSEAVPIIAVLEALSAVLPARGRTPQSEGAKLPAYGRADFSYDLYCAKRSVPGLSLVIATRSFTRHRSEFLWIPSDERGKGATYSHIRLSEESK